MPWGIGDIGEDLEDVAKFTGKAASKLTRGRFDDDSSDSGSSGSDPSSSAKTAKSGDSKKTDDTKKKTDTTPAAPPESAYEQLANAQADQYLQMEAKLQPLTSGATLPATESNMSQGAEAMLGQSATSPMAQWLNSQTSAAQAQNAPVEAANQAVSTAETQGQGLVASGLQQMGQAETAEIQAAPYTQLLTSLAADVPYKILGGYGQFNLAGITGKNVPEGLKAAETNLDVSTTGQTGGGTPTLPPVAGSITSATPTTPESTTASLTQ